MGSDDSSRTHRPIRCKRSLMFFLFVFVALCWLNMRTRAAKSTNENNTHKGTAITLKAAETMSELVVYEYPAVESNAGRPVASDTISTMCTVEQRLPSFDVAIFVFAWRRTASLRRLILSLQNAEYCGNSLALTVMFDARPDPGTVNFTKSVRWAHGTYRIVIEPRSKGIRGMWIYALSRELERHPSNVHILPIEDDIEVSPLFYCWLQRAAQAYGPFDTAAGSLRFKQLVGVSLYSPRADEVNYPMSWYKPRSHNAAGNAPAFLFQLPCSWGAVFFRDHWRRFLRFYLVRASLPFYNTTHEQIQAGYRKSRQILGDPVLSIKGARTSVWPRSWKRFMIDYMYGRGDVMLYPNAPADPHLKGTSFSFATTFMERGEHSGTDARVEKGAADKLRPQSTWDYRKTVPLVSRAQDVLTRDALARLPPFDELPVIDLLHTRASSVPAIVEKGKRFVRSRASAAARKQKGEQASPGEDDRPAVQHPLSPMASTEQYHQLEHIWLA